MSNFRKDLKGWTYTYQEVKSVENEYGFTDSDKFVPEDEVKSILDSIENDINMMKDMLEKIKGLNEIDDIYDIAKELSSKLY